MQLFQDTDMLIIYCLKGKFVWHFVNDLTNGSNSKKKTQSTRVTQAASIRRNSGIG